MSENIAVLYTNAKNIGFPTGTFDIVLCGFMGWDDCYDFVHHKFNQPDTKATEIHRVLKEAGRFMCYSWESQEDLAWMEETMERYYPSLLNDTQYLQERTIGMAHENAQGYEIILNTAGFRDIQVTRETAEFVSTDEAEFWWQMQSIGWDVFFKKIEKIKSDELQLIKYAIYQDIQSHKQADGIHFTKSVFYVSGVK
jgi:ubiquinone/menaquinone biosynthesis C-methylase UbiE